MPNNGINAPGQVSGSTYYLVIRNQTGQYLVPGTPIFENYNASHWTTYASGAATANTAGDWFGVFPANAATIAGIYSWQVRLRVGGTAAITDPTVFQDNQANWDGTGFLIPAEQGKVALAPTQSFNNTGQTTPYPTTPSSITVVNVQPVQR